MAIIENKVATTKFLNKYTYGQIEIDGLGVGQGITYSKGYNLSSDYVTAKISGGIMPPVNYRNKCAKESSYNFTYDFE